MSSLRYLFHSRRGSMPILHNHSTRSMRRPAVPGVCVPTNSPKCPDSQTQTRIQPIPIAGEPFFLKRYAQGHEEDICTRTIDSFDHDLIGIKVTVLGACDLQGRIDALSASAAPSATPFRPPRRKTLYPQSAAKRINSGQKSVPLQLSLMRQPQSLADKLKPTPSANTSCAEFRIARYSGSCVAL